MEKAFGMTTKPDALDHLIDFIVSDDTPVTEAERLATKAVFNAAMARTGCTWPRCGCFEVQGPQACRAAV